MGYKYGVWLTYPKNMLKCEHIGHVTVACYMSKEDAIDLYLHIERILGRNIEINIDCKNPVCFNKNMYDDDDNNMCSWGYNGYCLMWVLLKGIAENYRCNFSHQVHTTMEYGYNKQNFTLLNSNNRRVKCELNVADIRDDDPLKWKLVDIPQLTQL